MVDKHLTKVVKMATMTELLDVSQDDVSVIRNPTQHAKHALLMRYQRDPDFHDSLNKLVSSLQQNASHRNISFEELCGIELTKMLESQEPSQTGQNRMHTNYAILNSITEEPIDSMLKHSQHQEDS